MLFEKSGESKTAVMMWVVSFDSLFCWDVRVVLTTISLDKNIELFSVTDESISEVEIFSIKAEKFKRGAETDFGGGAKVEEGEIKVVSWGCIRVLFPSDMESFGTKSLGCSKTEEFVNSDAFELWK